jgi:putative ABC transport system permease protein
VNLVRLALKNIAGSPFRSAIVFLCVALVAGSAIWITLVIQGAEENLRRSMVSLLQPGVDIVIATRGGDVGMGGGAPASGPAEIRAVPGVAAASPQLHLTTLYDSPYCTDPELFLVAFDPATDFVVLPRLSQKLDGDLQVDEAIAGSNVSAAPGTQNINLSGYELKLVGQLSPTGTSLDHSLFVTTQTAVAMFRLSRYQAAAGVDNALNISPSSTPVILVKIQPGSDPHQVAVQILEKSRGVVPFEHVSFFQKGRAQVAGLQRSLPGLLAGTWVLSIVFIGLVFTVAVHQRRREIGVLRALGSTRKSVLWSILAEGLMLALAGGTVGALLATLAILRFRDQIVQSAGLPLSSPPPLTLLALAVGVVLLALVSVTLAALLPALSISRQEPAASMRG